MLTARNKMMMMALILSASGLTGSAAFSEEKLITSAHVGLALPMVGDLDDIGDTGMYFGAQTLSPVNSHTSVGAGVGYYTFGEESESQVDTEVSIISMLALMHRDLTAKGSGTPFIETGVGFARTQVNINMPGTSGPAIVQGSNEEDISPTFLLGFGLDMPVSDGATFGFSVDYQHFFFKVGNVDGGGSLSILAHLRV